MAVHDHLTARRRAGGWYKQATWKRLRAAQLARHPNCQCPHHCGHADAPLADVVDHITPHRGDYTLFIDPTNLQSMAKSCHDSRKQSQEKGGAGFLRGCDSTGQPLDKSHPWYKTQRRPQ
jgi:5-methylcytosine-specific restriction endonuclease McrA